MARQHDQLVEVSAPGDRLLTDENLIVHQDLLREPAIRRSIDAIARLFKIQACNLRGEMGVRKQDSL